MAGETRVTIVGALGADPEIRFTPSGAAVANFTVASTPRQFDRQSNEWKDGETLWMRCSVWREMAENVIESFTKGDRVIVTGTLEQRSFEDRDGNQRTVVEMQVEECGPSIRWATAQPRRVTRDDQRATPNLDRVREQVAQTRAAGYAETEPPF